ncbi:hypothetical protein HYS50_03680 [Candidatus Woesearchaeota archaeon]|nr:hypothetical protein [Candidatus Woesearchaeota archaeon]
MEDEIHFLVDELEGELHNKVQSILKELDKPVQKKDNMVVKKFTRALVQATARRWYKQPQHQQSVQQTDAFAQLRRLERHPFPQPMVMVVPQPTYYTPVMPPPPIQQAVPQEQPPTAQPTLQQPKDTFLPSGLPPKPPEVQPLPKLPTDETLAFTPDSFTQYKLPLSPEAQNAQTNPQFAPPLPAPPAPTPQLKPPIAVTVPPGAEPPIALIVDAESKKPIVSVTIQDNIYTVTEPALAPEEINMITLLRKKFSGKEKKLAKKKKLNKKIWKAAKKMHFSMQKNDDNEYLKMKYYLVKHLLQSGWIEPLFHDDAITKIMCEGENSPVTIIRNNQVLKTNITYPSAEHINRFLMKFAGRAKKKVSGKNPIFDFTANSYHLEGSLQTATTRARFTLTKVA